MGCCRRFKNNARHLVLFLFVKNSTKPNCIFKLGVGCMVGGGGDQTVMCVSPPPLQVGYKNPTGHSPSLVLFLYKTTVLSVGHQSVEFKKPTAAGFKNQRNPLFTVSCLAPLIRVKPQHTVFLLRQSTERILKKFQMHKKYIYVVLQLSCFYQKRSSVQKYSKLVCTVNMYS